MLKSICVSSKQTIIVKRSSKEQLKNLLRNVDERDEEQNAGFLDCW